MHSQHEQAVLSICPGPNKKWHVKDSAARSALASFNNVQDACAWAIEVAQNRQARVVVERTESSVKGGAGSDSTAYAIPVAWSATGTGRTGRPRS